MAYLAKHKAAGRYGVLTPNNEWLDGFLGTKQEAEAKANELNSVNDSNSVNPGINSTGENAEQTEQVISDSGLEETSEDDQRARAPFVSADQVIDEAVKPESIKQEAAKGNANSTQASKRFVLVKGKGWIYQ